MPNARHHPRPYSTYMRGMLMGVGCMPLLGGVFTDKFLCFQSFNYPSEHPAFCDWI
jgi:hypothetical protein